MPLTVHKPIDRPQHISILLPTRQRPQNLQKFFDSLEETTRDKNDVDVWVYVDLDDELTRQYFDSNAPHKYAFKIHWIRGGRQRTMGEMFNLLREKCATNPGIFSPGTDDNLFVAQHWDELVRDAFNSQPDHILMAYPTDPTASPDQVTWPIVSAEWTNVLGRYMTEYFPYWFDDTWLDQVAQMVQRKVKLPFRIEPQADKGKTHRMRNLVFWESFFGQTLDERINDATRLIQSIAPEGSSDFNALLEKARDISRRFAEQGRNRNAEKLIDMERRLTAEPTEGKVPLPDPGHLEVEMDATKRLYRKLHAALGEGRFADALDLLNALSFASVRLKNQEPLERHCVEQLKRAGLTHPAINSRSAWSRLRKLLQKS